MRVTKIILVIVAMYFSGCASFIAHQITRPIENAEMYNMQINDLNICYYEVGDKKKPPLVFLHGILAFTEAYKHIILELSEQYFIIGIDLPGHGRSSISSRKLTHKDIGDYIVQVTTQLDIDKFYVVGHSAGGVIALSLGKYFPDNIIKIATIASLYNYDGLSFENKYYTFLTEDGFKDHSGKRKDLIFNIFEIAHGKLGEKDKFDLTIDYMEEYGRMIYPSFSDSDLQNIETPVIVLIAEKDEIINVEHGERMAKSVLNGKSLIISNATHASIVRSNNNVKKVCHNIFAFFSVSNPDKI